MVVTEEHLRAVCPRARRPWLRSISSKNRSRVSNWRIRKWESTARILRTWSGPPANDLRAICDSLNDERGRSGQFKLARSLGCNYSAVWRKLNGKSSFAQVDMLAIRQLVRSPADRP